jgi:hypothetical protein
MAQKRTAKKIATKRTSPRLSTKENVTKKSVTKKKSAGPTSGTKSAAKSSAKKTTRAAKKPSRDKATKDPKGGLTEAGRKYFNQKEGSHLKPGVKGAADTPEKKKRKGSFLRRHFANPRGPMEKDGGPTRFALSAQAWDEPLPKTAAAAKKLAAKGTKLLKAYSKTKGK